MKICTICGTKVDDGAISCPCCGGVMQAPVQVNTDATGQTPADAPSFGYAILGFFIPIVGLVLYLMNKDTAPLKAKSAGKGAIIGTIVGAISYIFIIIIYVVIYVFLISEGYYYL